MPIHPKGTQFTSYDLFPHLGTVLGFPDFIVMELLNAFQMVKKREGGYAASAYMHLDFKSNNYFTNTNVEITLCKLDDFNAQLMRIGDISESPRFLYAECKSHCLHKQQHFKVIYCKVVKLIRRYFGKMINQVLVDDATSTCKKHQKER